MNLKKGVRASIGFIWRGIGFSGVILDQLSVCFSKRTFHVVSEVVCVCVRLTSFTQRLCGMMIGRGRPKYLEEKLPCCSGIEPKSSR
jgi:putative Mn2+ efflux pump MntP